MCVFYSLATSMCFLFMAFYWFIKQHFDHQLLFFTIGITVSTCTKHWNNCCTYLNRFYNFDSSFIGFPLNKIKSFHYVSCDAHSLSLFDHISEPDESSVFSPSPSTCCTHPIGQKPSGTLDDYSDWSFCLSLKANGGDDWLTCPERISWLAVQLLSLPGRLDDRRAVLMLWQWAPDKQHLDRVCLKHNGSTHAQLTAKGRDGSPVGTRGGGPSCFSEWVSLPPPSPATLPPLEKKLTFRQRPVSCVLCWGGLGNNS